MRHVTVNLNGDTAESLAIEIDRAKDAVDVLLSALQAMTIHGRNYQTDANPQAAFLADRRDRNTHMNSLDAIRNWLIESHNAAMKHTNVKCFDAGPAVLDRYTVIYLDEYDSRTDTCAAVGMSENPSHPPGYGQHVEIAADWMYENTDTQIKFADLPDACQHVVNRDLSKLA